MSNEAIDKAHWNGMPCEVVRGSAVCGKAPKVTWWCSDRVGERIKCLKIESEGQVFFLADEDGSASRKVFGTMGGLWDGPHSSLPVDDPETFKEEA